VSPPLYFLRATAPRTSVVLSPNATRADVVIKATRGYSELTSNGGFDAGPDDWFIGWGGNLTDVGGYWFSSILGRSGVVLLNGTLYSSRGRVRIVYGEIFVLQNITVPNTLISAAVLNITYYFTAIENSWVLFSSYYAYVALAEPGGSIVWSDTLTLTENAWVNASFPIPTSALTPGGTYTLIVGVYAEAALLNLGLLRGTATLYYLLDSARLYVLPEYPSYANDFLKANVTSGNYLVSLSVDSIQSLGSVNATIALANLTGSTSSPIVVINSALLNSETSSIRVTTPPPGYLPLSIHASTSMLPGSKLNLILTLQYGTGGVTVKYRINLTIVDPEPGKQFGKPRKPIQRVLEPIDPCLIKLAVTTHKAIPLQRWLP